MGSTMGKSPDDGSRGRKRDVAKSVTSLCLAYKVAIECTMHILFALRTIILASSTCGRELTA